MFFICHRKSTILNDNQHFNTNIFTCIFLTYILILTSYLQHLLADPSGKKVYSSYLLTS